MSLLGCLHKWGLAFQREKPASGKDKWVSRESQLPCAAQLTETISHQSPPHSGKAPGVFSLFLPGVSGSGQLKWVVTLARSKFPFSGKVCTFYLFLSSETELREAHSDLPMKSCSGKINVRRDFSVTWVSQGYRTWSLLCSAALLKLWKSSCMHVIGSCLFEASKINQCRKMLNKFFWG